MQTRAPELPSPTPSKRFDVHAALSRAVANVALRQESDGSWPGDYGGPTFLLPMYLMLAYAAGDLPTGARLEGMVKVLIGRQNPDGSVGLSAGDRTPSVFASVLAYVGLRILGIPPHDERLVALLRSIRAHGGPLGIASWGKVLLALFGLYDWDGVTPVLPELWLLPAASPIHPRRLWCHCRQVYLPMSWLYGTRATLPVSDLVRSLRDELYEGTFSSIAWKAQRSNVAEVDAYRAPTRLLRVAQKAIGTYEDYALPSLRARALEHVRRHIAYEDEVTQYIDIGPVNKVLNAFVAFFEGAGSEEFRRSFRACEFYLYDGYDGTKMQGYNSSRLWDVAFAMQALMAARAADPTAFAERAGYATLEKAYGYLRDNQILEDPPHRHQHYRDRSRGGWPFSNRAHGWPITDCTSEGLKCALAMEGPRGIPIEGSLLRDAVDRIVEWQNDDGGWATYERTRGSRWLEALNPSDVFGEIMIDYSYVECTSACVQALVDALGCFGATVDPQCHRAIERGVRFLRASQRADGSFEGSWGVCFTYGTWFGVSGLLAAGVPSSDPAVRRACAFLLQKQRADGGWGEDGESCRKRQWVEAREAHMAQTAWALSTLVRAGDPAHEAQERAASLLARRQESDGSWPREPLVGVFNKTCLIDYENYRHYFPMWALAEWASSAIR